VKVTPDTIADVARCDCGACPPNAVAHELRAACHPRARLRAAYVPVPHVLVLACGECSGTVMELFLPRPAADRVSAPGGVS
jgi:hypothetical protein